MTDLKLYNAFAVSNDDPEETGCVQIKSFLNLLT
jgi:hypothetical protein